MQELLQQLPGNLQQGGINGVLLDLGISSMQVSKQGIWSRAHSHLVMVVAANEL